jgi:hypothetical protein
MKSHEYAKKLQEIAQFLLDKPEFETHSDPKIHLFFWSNKEEFLTAVRCVGAGRKEWGKSDLDFIPAGLPADAKLILNISRSSVCRKIQDEKWECEPLLSSDEEAQMGDSAA